MLLITIPAAELWDEKKEQFIYTKEQTLQLEHSLVSLSKWESKWHKPFLGKEDKTTEETLDYIRCMTLTQNVAPDVYTRLSNANILQVNAYISDPMTATWFTEDKNARPNKQVVTAEIIYHWMIELQIPFECQKWHLNRLLTLIRVRNIKCQPPKKVSKRDTAAKYAALNAARRKKLNSKG